MKAQQQPYSGNVLYIQAVQKANITFKSVSKSMESMLQ